MRIVEREPARLVLAGVPGGWQWMVVLTVAGLAATVGCGLFIARLLTAGQFWPLVPAGVGLLLGQVFFWSGAVTLAVGRERLELDRTTGRGRYLVRSPIIETGCVNCEFDLNDVDGVEVGTQIEVSPTGGVSGHHGPRRYEVCRARLRIREPRCAVPLIERPDSARSEVWRVAEAVAAFTGLDLIDTTATDQPERRRSRSGSTQPRLARAATAAEIPAQPEPREWSVDHDEVSGRFRIARLRRGGPPALGCFLVLTSLLSLIGLAMAVGVWLPGQTFNGRPIRLVEQLLISLPGGGFGLAVAWAWWMLLTGRRCITVDREAMQSAWEYPGAWCVAWIPGLGRLLAPVETVATPEVDSIATVDSPGGRVVEVRSPTARWRVGSVHADDAAEAASLRWLAKALTTARSAAR